MGLLLRIYFRNRLQRNSRIDVEQILGRILRQPYARRQSNDLLNLSYVFTCSNAFHVTLGDVVKGLNRAGFGDKDYRVAGVEGFPASDLPSRIWIIRCR